MTTERPSAETIDSHAIGWVTRRDKGELDAQAQVEFDNWLASDTRCQGAFARAEAAWALLDRARALATANLPASSSVDIPLVPMQQRAVSRRQVLWGGGLAAALVAGVGVYGLLAYNGARYETIIGEIRRIPLQDGSVVALNTASRLNVELEAQLRAIDLTDGEAWFQVAKDATRPFVVSAGRVRVRAVGTAFSVRRREQGVDVLVTEGVVSAWVEGEENAAVRIAAGSKAFVNEGRIVGEVEQAPVAIERSLAWRERKIDLQGVTLAQAAQEFNRYNNRKLVVEGAALAAEPLVGRFEIDAVQSFAQAAARMLNAKIIETQGELRLVRSNSGS